MKKLCLLLLVVPFISQAQKTHTVSLEAQAKNVTIIRDTWGLPHVYGKTDAACVFGLAYVQAEDNMEQVEDNYIRALGRGAEVHGEESFTGDYFSHAFELEKLSRQEYEAAPPAMRALYKAYADGLNFYLQKHRDYQPALLQHYEPWYALTFIRYFYYYEDILPMAGISPNDLRTAAQVDIETHSSGSNAWAIGAKKQAEKRRCFFSIPTGPYLATAPSQKFILKAKPAGNFQAPPNLAFPFPTWATTET